MSLPVVTPRRSLGLKLIIVCALVLLMAIPAMFISYIAFERSDRADEVTREVSARYGGPQYISGPFLIAPYVSRNGDASVSEIGTYAVFAETGEARFEDITTSIRQRSLFKVPTYDAKGTMTGRFAAIDNNFDTGAAQVEWEKAKIVVALSDVRGLNEDVTAVFAGGITRNFEPENMEKFSEIGAHVDAVAAVKARAMRGALAPDGRMLRAPIGRYAGFNAHQPQTYLSVPVGDMITKGKGFDVTVELAVSGAKVFGLTPFAKSTAVSLSSDWPDPGFSGGFAPRDRTISEAGFSASWSVPYLRRGIRAHGKAHTLKALTSPDRLMSAQLVSGLSPYQTINRALKYSVLFIGLVFLAYFLFEVIVGVRVHPAQYVLIGLTQCIFYLLLLAFSERIGFPAAFLLAAGSTIAVTAGYAGAVFGGRSYTVRAGLVFGIVYGLLYSLMRLQDFALMIGALTSFIAVALTMYLTRETDWYGLSMSPHSAGGRRAVQSDKIP